MAKKIADILTKEDLSDNLNIPKSMLLHEPIREGKVPYYDSKRQHVQLDLPRKRTNMQN